MARPYISTALRTQVAEDAQHRCGYCLTSQIYTAMPLQIEHIIPLAIGGNSERANLWLACPLCNGRKATRTTDIDPGTSESVPLFNPRQQEWKDHFAWSDDGILILGVTSTGRATVEALQLNHEHFRQARRRWVAVGWHPPTQYR